MQPGQVAGTMPVSLIREVWELARRDSEAIHLEVGEPDFPTPPHIVQAAAEAGAAGHTRYTPNAGVPELRRALAGKVAERNGYAVDPQQVVVTAGGVEALHAVLRALLDPGDHVLMPDPAWPNFTMIAHLIGAEVGRYPLTAETGFLPKLADLDRLVGPRTRVLLLNTPSNPLGSVLPAPLFEELLAFARRHRLWVISDEVYDELVFDETFVSAGVLASPEDALVSIYSFSKVYAMTGWRVGYCVAPLELAALLTQVQEPIVSCVNAPAQQAALAALQGPQDAVAEMRAAYHARRDELLAALGRGGIPAVRPSGAFYVWVDVSATGLTSMEFTVALLEREHVAVAPGSAFGPAGEGYVRLSLASSTSDLREGAARLARAVEELRPAASPIRA